MRKGRSGSAPLTNGSGRPKNIRIRIPNIDFFYFKTVIFLNLGPPTLFVIGKNNEARTEPNLTLTRLPDLPTYWTLRVKHLFSRYGMFLGTKINVFLGQLYNNIINKEHIHVWVYFAFIHIGGKNSLFPLGKMRGSTVVCWREGVGGGGHFPQPGKNEYH